MYSQIGSTICRGEGSRQVLTVSVERELYPCVFIQAHISHLKEVLVARDEEVAELTMQNKSCQCQLAEAHGRIVELEARSVSSYLSRTVAH